MTQHVRMNMLRQAFLARTCGQSLLNGAHAKSGTALAGKQRVFCARCKPPPRVHPLRQRRARRAAHRYQALFVALTANPDLTLAENILRSCQIQSSQFGQAQPGGIKKLEHRRVAHLQNIRFGFAWF